MTKHNLHTLQPDFLLERDPMQQLLTIRAVRADRLVFKHEEKKERKKAGRAASTKVSTASKFDKMTEGMSADQLAVLMKQLEGQS